MLTHYLHHSEAPFDTDVTENTHWLVFQFTFNAHLFTQQWLCSLMR